MGIFHCFVVYMKGRDIEAVIGCKGEVSIKFVWIGVNRWAWMMYGILYFSLGVVVDDLCRKVYFEGSCECVE